MVNQF